MPIWPPDGVRLQRKFSSLAEIYWGPAFAPIYNHVLKAYREASVTPESVIELRELQTALVMVAAGTGICIVPDAVTLAARPGIGFAPLAQDVRVPLMVRFRKHDQSLALRAFMGVYEELHREWGWIFPATLTSGIFASSTSSLHRTE